MKDVPNPSVYGLPHDDWRPGQYETVRKIIGGFKLNNKYRIVQAPTGSGKSAIATALSGNGIRSVRTVTNTINLQKQYESLYGFDPIYGMHNYPCAVWSNTLQASSCVYPEAMFNCPAKEVCEYLIQRNKVKWSYYQSMSYAYLLAAVWPWDAVTDYIVFDEGHLLPQITKDACTVEYTPEQVYKWDVEPYPTTQIGSMPLRVKIAVAWLRKVLLVHTKEYNRLLDIPAAIRKKNPSLMKKLHMISQHVFTLRRTIDHADNNPTDFYCTWDEESFKLVPLTSKLYFKQLFIRGGTHKPVIMSATIGNPDTFAAELGLGNMWEFIDTPSQFPPESMPVYTFDDAPRLSHKTTATGWNKWADTVHKVIKDSDPRWSGMIHVASRNQANLLAEKLAKKGLAHRLYIPEGKSTSDKISAWDHRKKKVKNTIAITYSFFMGLDAGDDEINIIGKIPFETLDEVGMAKLRYNSTLYRYNAALKTEQAAGRIRRGEAEHYEEEGKPRRKVVAIADGNYHQIQDQFSGHFRQCLTQY